MVCLLVRWSVPRFHAYPSPNIRDNHFTRKSPPTCCVCVCVFFFLSVGGCQDPES